MSLSNSGGGGGRSDMDPLIEIASPNTDATPLGGTAWTILSLWPVASGPLGGPLWGTCPSLSTDDTLGGGSGGFLPPVGEVLGHPMTLPHPVFAAATLSADGLGATGGGGSLGLPGLSDTRAADGKPGLLTRGVLLEDVTELVVVLAALIGVLGALADGGAEETGAELAEDTGAAAVSGALVVVTGARIGASYGAVTGALSWVTADFGASFGALVVDFESVVVDLGSMLSDLGAPPLDF